MKAATINEIKNELEQCTGKELIAYCIRLAKYKKENKELLTYIFFEEKFADSFIENIKKEMDQHFREINHSNIYYTKKSLRKVLRYVNKYIRFANSKLLEAEMLIHFCNNMVDFKIPLLKSIPLMNMYQAQLRKINLTLAALHPDLGYDLARKLKKAGTA